MNAGNWVHSDATANLEARLAFKKIMQYHQSHKAGFSSISIPEILARNSHAYRKLLLTVQKEADKETLLKYTVHLKLQGHCTKWCSIVRLDFSWKSLLSIPPSVLSLSIGAA